MHLYDYKKILFSEKKNKNVLNNNNFFKKKIFIRLEQKFCSNNLDLSNRVLYFYFRLITVFFFFNYFKSINISKYYLLNTHRGYCCAVGKPMRGQRTWSNAWTAYKINKTFLKILNKKW